MMTSLDDAFTAAPRQVFLPAEVRPYADLDQALPIGHEATNSQPYTVRYMLALLDVLPGGRVLDVGSGSGWTCALLALLAGPGGRVWGVDIVPELVEMGRANLARWATTTAEAAEIRVERARRGVLGWPDQGPYDRILVSADGGYLPAQLVEQLAPGGRMVIPVAHHMMVVDRLPDGSLTTRDGGGSFSFVPLR